MGLKMLNLVENIFENDVDKGGEPYAGHLCRVADRFLLEDDVLYEAALGHDILEDHPEYTKELLLDMGFDCRVIELIVILTRKPDEIYFDYVKRVSLDEDTIKIKLSDLEDNMDITRLSEFGDKEFSLLKRYHKAYSFLKNIK